MALLDILHISTQGGGLPSATVVLSSVANGNSIVVQGLAFFNGTASPDNCTDNKGNTYTRYQVFSSDGNYTPFWLANNVIGGNVTITLNVPSADTWVQCLAYEIDNQGNILEYGATISAFQTSAGTFNSGSIVTTNPIEALFGVVNTRQSPPFQNAFTNDFFGHTTSGLDGYNGGGGSPFTPPAGNAGWGSLFGFLKTSVAGTYSCQGTSDPGGQIMFTQLIAIRVPPTPPTTSNFPALIVSS